MRHAAKALVGIIVTVMLVLGGLFLTTPTPAAEAQDTQGCVINVLGVKVCGTLLGQPLPEAVTVTVQGPTITVPPVTVTDVVTVRPDPIRLTETIRPDPVRVTETVTLPPAPQATAVVTVTENADGTPNSTSSASPQATVTETVRPNGEPVPTVTETVEVEVSQDTGQDPDVSGSIEPEQDDEPFFSPDVDFDFTDPTITEAGIGLLAALLLIGLIMGCMMYGFYRGRKSEQSGEADFLRTLLDRSKTS